LAQFNAKATSECAALLPIFFPFVLRAPPKRLEKNEAAYTITPFINCRARLHGAIN
jgi:hypothetical protein